MKRMIAMLSALAVLSLPLPAVAADAVPAVGGACVYKEYEGSALITEISQRQNSSNGAFEVKFLFYPAAGITETFAQLEGKTLLLLTERGTLPKSEYVSKNGIEVGNYYDCVMKVIVKGPCPPTIFQFPSFTE